MTVKYWFVKILVESFTSFFISSFYIWLSNKLGFISITDVIIMSNVRAPVFILLFMFIYVNLRCTLPISGIGK
jgi:hypothetical protein